jgi:hypothetical protein
VFGFGLKQSSSTLSPVLLTVEPSTFSESKPLVFFGNDCVLGSVTFFCARKHRMKYLHGIDVHMIKGYFLYSDQKVGPVRRIQEFHTFNMDICDVVHHEKDQPIKRVRRVLPFENVLMT